MEQLKPQLEKFTKEKIEAKEKPILDNRFKFLMLGKDFGDFRPLGKDMSYDVATVSEKLGIRYAFAMSQDFTRRTASVTDDSEKVYVLGPDGTKKRYEEGGVLRTIDKADGMIVFFDELKKLGIDRKEFALAAYNADCPFIIGYEPEKDALFMLHSGLKCLHVKGEEGKETIFRQLIAKYGLNPEKMKIYVAPGIRDCCYGKNDDEFPDVMKHWGAEFGSVATKGKRKGQPSIDIPAMIQTHLEENGVPSGNIEMDPRCSACDEESFWSNVRGETGRNLLLVRTM